MSDAQEKDYAKSKQDTKVQRHYNKSTYCEGYNFSIITYSCENGTTRKAEQRKVMPLNCGLEKVVNTLDSRKNKSFNVR